MRTYCSLLVLLLLSWQYTFGQKKPSSKFEAIMDYLQSPADTIYIQNRHNLEKITGLKCNDSSANFNYTSRAGSKLNIKVSVGKFEPTKHKIYLSDTAFKIIQNQKRIDYLINRNLIDGKEAYGNFGEMPKIEIKGIKIKWNDTWLNIPDSTFKNLYEVHICLNYLPLEAYITKNKLIYLYIPASDGAGSFAVKFVFNAKGYVTRIVNTYEAADGFDFMDGIASGE